jgi:hypothetical protein
VQPHAQRLDSGAIGAWRPHRHGSDAELERLTRGDGPGSSQTQGWRRWLSHSDEENALRRAAPLQVQRFIASRAEVTALQCRRNRSIERGIETLQAGGE